MQEGLAGDSDVSAYLEESLAGDAGNLSSLRRTLDLARLEALAARLYRARRIVLLGATFPRYSSTFLNTVWR
jgi:DNA-binding MurR/RpiR family transcriptional regulator